MFERESSYEVLSGLRLRPFSGFQVLGPQKRTIVPGSMPLKSPLLFPVRG